MEERQEIHKDENIIKNILFVLKKNFLLMLAIIIVATSLGFGYSCVKKPNYTAYVRINFCIDNAGGATTSTINEMRLYIDTIVYFCAQGVVVDRANNYYSKWIDNHKEKYYAEEKTIEDFFKDYATPSTENELFYKYARPNESDEGTLSDENFIVSSAINAQTKKTDDATNWVYTISYTDSDQLDAYEKAHILVLAYKHELDNELKNKEDIYFTNLDINIENLGFDGITSNVSKLKIIIISFLIGVIIAFAVIYIKNKFDETMNDKYELERIVGVQVIGSIDYVREDDINGK